MDVKFSNNLFLAVAELNKLKQSLGEKGWKIFAKNLVKQFGIAQTNNNTQFFPVAKSGETEVITIKPGVAFDSDMNIIVLNDSVDISVPASQLSRNQKYFVILRHGTTHYEEGSVNISADGALTGNGTDFLNVLRGQPDFPTKVRLFSQVNTGDYEVVSVSSSVSAVLAGSFTAEQNLRYSVIGTFTPGFIPNNEDAEIYEYDSCELRVVVAEDIDSLALEKGKEFVICGVDYINSVMQILDYRIYYLLNNPYLQSSQSMKSISEDKLVSMVSCSIVSLNKFGMMLELEMEHGFKITDFETVILSTGYAVDIQGYCNIYASEQNIPNHALIGWYLLNRGTMAYSVIDDNTAGRLTISNLNPDSINGTDLIIVPPFKEIEYQVMLDSQVPSPAVPYIFKCNSDNLRNKIQVPILFPEDSVGGDVTIALRYRMIGSGEEKYLLKKFQTSNYQNYNGESGVLSDSAFIVHSGDVQPIESSRNYS